MLSQNYTFNRALHKKMKFSIKVFSSKCDEIRSFLRIWSHLLEKSLMEKNCAVGLLMNSMYMHFFIHEFLPLFFIVFDAF